MDTLWVMERAVDKDGFTKDVPSHWLESEYEISFLEEGCSAVFSYVKNREMNLITSIVKDFSYDKDKLKVITKNSAYTFKQVQKQECCKLAYADLVFLSALGTLTEEGTWDENPRPKYKDGTPANSFFITDMYVKYKADVTPIISLRHTAWKTGIREIIAIYQKQVNTIAELEDLGVKWWADWNIGDGSIGIRYGATIKKWDLMNKLLSSLVNDPFSRRHIIDMYQYADMQETGGLHPCAFLTEWSCRRAKDGKMYLDMHLVQRSSDFGTAYSINQIQYKALQMMVACHCGYEV